MLFKEKFESSIIWRGSAAVVCAGIVLALPASAVRAQDEKTPPVLYSPEVQAMRAAARQAGVPEHELPRQTVADLRQSKLVLSPWERKLSSAVRDRFERLMAAGISSRNGSERAADYATGIVPIDRHSRLLVEAKVTRVAPFDAKYFEGLGGLLVSRAQGYGLVLAWIPVDRLQSFADRKDVRHIYGVGPHHTDLGSVLTEGDAIHNADTARAECGLDGTGQLVGVISNGVDNLAAAQGTGDVGAVNVLDNTNGGDEGTGMLEIVADLAPGANLAFHTGFPGAATMINGINDLVAAGATIITDDLPFPREPVFEDGPIAQAKQAAVASNVFYTASAGNRGNEHHQNNFNGTTANVAIGPNVYLLPHDFGGADFQLQATVTANSGGFTFYLQWAEQFGSSGIDLDLFILDNAGNVLASSTGVQDGDDNPLEVAGATVASGSTVNVVIDVVSGNTNVFFDLRAFGTGGWEYLIPQGSINGASRQAVVYAAGAVNQATPATVRGFSSRGPARQFFPATVTRMKPDGVATDGVSITGAGGFGAGACPAVNPGDCRFNGTSASTPHVAGMAALLLESQLALTPAGVATALNTTAVDIDLPGPDNNAGNGRLDVFAAIVSLDLEPPVVNCPADLTVECDGNGNVAQRTAWLNSATATDNCGLASFDNDFAGLSDDCGATGSALVTWTAVDNNGNDTACAATFTIEDTLAPTPTCPAGVTITCGESIDPEDTGMATATDICDDTPAVTFTDLVTPTICPADPIQEVIDRTWTAEDECLNSSSCPQAITVKKIVGDLDIKPSSCPNPLNRNVGGVLPVGLLGSLNFDISMVDLSTLQISRADCVGGAVSALAGPPGPQTILRDVGTPFEGELCDCHNLEGDGMVDLEMYFRIREVVSVLELASFGRDDEVELVVSGTLLDGCEFIASDCVLIRR